MTEHEELLMLRALAAKQAQELENKNKIIEKQDAKIRKQNIELYRSCFKNVAVELF